MYYIMNATGRDNLFTTPRTPAEAVAEWADSDETCLVCRRETGWDRYSPIFVFGYGHGYTDISEKETYTQDTGNGYRNIGEYVNERHHKVVLDPNWQTLRTYSLGTCYIDSTRYWWRPTRTSRWCFGDHRDCHHRRRYTFI